MKNLFFFTVLTTVLAAATTPIGAQAPAVEGDRYIVTLAPGADAAAVAATHGVAPRHVFTAALHGFAGFVPPGRLKALAEDPQVVSVTPDWQITAFGKPGSGGGTPTPTQVVPAGVGRIGAAPGTLTVTGAGIGVAVLDTGIDFNHSDLAPLGGISFSAYGTSAQDNNGHGTHVSGIIAARNNSVGVVGVAPQATLYAVKVLDASGNGFDSDIIAGLDWVATVPTAPPIRVINMSLGRLASTADQALHDAIANVVAAGISVVVAAGNDNTKVVSQMVPAGFPEVIAVASTTAKQGATSKVTGYIPADAASYFTTDGSYDPSTGVGVAISAPGEDQEDCGARSISSLGILSTKLGGGTTRMAGTSMASPHAAGVAALMYQANPLLGPVEVKARIMMSGDRDGIAPLDSRTSKGYVVTGYTFDTEREGILYAPKALAP